MQPALEQAHRFCSQRGRKLSWGVSDWAYKYRHSWRVWVALEESFPEWENFTVGSKRSPVAYSQTPDYFYNSIIYPINIKTKGTHETWVVNVMDTHVCQFQLFFVLGLTQPHSSGSNQHPQDTASQNLDSVARLAYSAWLLTTICYI